MTNNTVVRKIRSASLAAIVLPLLLLSPSAATATPTFGVDYFISPPLVQGTYVTTGLTQITFDLIPIGACPSDLTPTGSSVTVTLTGICNVEAGGDFGGATRTDATAAHGGARSRYANVGGGAIGDNTNGATFTFSTPQVYMGVWWSAGSAANRIRFYDGSSEVLSLTTADLFAAFGSAPTSGPLSATPTVTAVNGTTQYPKSHFWGHPFGHTATPPTNRSSVTPAEPFVFLHVFGSGGLKFDSVRLDGGGFEFDNLVVSSSAQTPDNLLVRIGGIVGTPTAVPTPAPAPAAPAPTGQPVALATTGGEFSYALVTLAAIAIVFGSLAIGFSRRKRSDY